jgi:hypothetical protein
VVPLTTTAIAARLGPVPLGGQQVAMRVWYLLALLLDALAVPAQVYVSSCLGAGDRPGARLVGRRTLRLGLAAGTGLAAVTAALAPWVPALFTADAAIRHAAFMALLVAAVTQPMAALAFVLDGLILGLSDYVAMRRAMILAVAAYAPMAALVLAFPRLGLPGVWVALGLWLAARAALLGRRWRAEFGSLFCHGVLPRHGPPRQAEFNEAPSRYELEGASPPFRPNGPCFSNADGARTPGRGEPSLRRGHRLLSPCGRPLAARRPPVPRHQGNRATIKPR